MFRQARRKWTTDRIFTRLAGLGVATVRVGFSGGNDDGGITGIVATLASGGEQHWEETYRDEGAYQVVDGKWTFVEKKAEPLTEHQEMVNEMAQSVYDKYGSFAGEFYVGGYFLWDVATGKLTEHSTREACDFD